jgi:hypothetical protein
LKKFINYQPDVVEFDKGTVVSAEIFAEIHLANPSNPQSL